MGHTELFPKCSECKKYLRHEVPAPFVEPLHQSSQSEPADWSGVEGHTSISKARSSPKNSFCTPIPKITVATSAMFSMACNTCVSFSAWQYHHYKGRK